MIIIGGGTKHMPNGTECISIFGSFVDKKLENSFIAKKIRLNLVFIRPLFIFVGLIYLLFSISDYMYLKTNHIYITIVIRLLFFFISFGMAFIIKHCKSSNSYLTLITIYELVFVLSYLLVISQSAQIEYFYKCFDFVIITIGIFLFPNKWILSFLVASMNVICFFIVIRINIPVSQYHQHYAPSIVYLSLVVILVGFSSYLTNYFNHQHFFSDMEKDIRLLSDELTGIYNKSAFDEKLIKYGELSVKKEYPLCLTVIDIDNFKKVNDRYGHIVGDRVICDVVNIINKTIRSSDIMSRWGGDEFAVISPNQNLKLTIRLMNEIRNKISSTKFERVGQITCSFGISELHKGENLEHFLNRADKMMYEAKSIGKNIVVGYEAG